MDVFKKPKRKLRRFNKKRANKSNKPSKSFTKKVQAIISKNVETKHAYYTAVSVSKNAGITTGTDAMQLLPNIVEGTSSHNRLGDQTRAQFLTVKGFIASNILISAASTCRLGIRLMIVQPKQYSNFAQIIANAAIWMQYLLKKGGTTTAFTGATPDLMADVNTDAITCYYDKIFYVNTPYLLTGVGDVTVNNSIKFFSKTFKLRNKLLKYDDNVDSGLTPVNYNPVLLLGYVRLDGSGPSADDHMNISYDSYLHYEDA